MKKKWNEKGILEIGMYNEKDQYQEQALKNTVFDSLQSSSSGSLQLSTAVVDNMGEYIFEDNIFIYGHSARTMWPMARTHGSHCPMARTP